MKEWIKVKDDLPRNGQMVLYIQRTLGGEIRHCRFDKMEIFGNPGKFVLEYDGKWMFDPDGFWMPAPALP